MGRDADIRQYETHPSGQPMELFAAEPGSRPGRLAVLIELLRSPWVVRGSDLPASEAGSGPHRFEEPVEVEWDVARRMPAAFVRGGGRRFAVGRVAQVWAVERCWWDPSRRVSRRCFRVLAAGGVYDLAYDRVASRWLLLGVAD